MPRRRIAPDDTREALDSIRRIVRFLRRNAATEGGPREVTAAQLFVLQILAAEESLSVNELARRTYTDQSTVSVVAKRLVGRGLVARSRASDDRRRVELALTRRGRDLVGRSARGAPSARLVEAIAGLDAPARRRLARSLAALVGAMGLAHDPAPLLFEDGLDRRR